MAISLKPFRNQVVVITGASSRIGLVTEWQQSRAQNLSWQPAMKTLCVNWLMKFASLVVRRSTLLRMLGKKEDVNRIAEDEHARSYMLKQSAHRGMIYPPEAILYSAEHPKRDMYVGFQAKFLAMLAGIAPKLTDKLIEIWALPSQQFDRPSRDREDNALYRAGYRMHERGTHQGWIRSGSLYAKAVEASGVHNHCCRWSWWSNLVTYNIDYPKLLDLHPASAENDRFLEQCV